MIKYEFSKVGINKMYKDSLEDVFNAMEEINPTHTLDELNIKITIGDRQTEILVGAEEFEMIFDCLRKIEEETK